MTGTNLRLALTIPVVMLAPAPVTVQAQGAPPLGVQCLTRSIVDANGAAQSLTIHVPAGEAATYQGRGFVPGACGAMSLTDYRTETCRLARMGNDAVQARLTQILGAAPKDLCDSVQRVAPYPANPGT